MALKLYNTLTRKEQKFNPIQKDLVKMYICGPTIYDYAHIGNLRAYLFGDILRRFLKFSGYRVKEVMNLTDVDDKTIRGSKKAGESLRKFTDKYEKVFLEDIKEINIEKPEVMPRATEHIKEMVALIKKLLNKGIAYKANDGIYFSIKKFKDYGKLSGVKVEELKIGASERVKKDEYDKENANDFVLWKFYDQEDGDVFWETEIGKGRPGWHIECSAMSMKYLGESFDIHLGGTDLVFPHHENEIAQSEAATGKPFVRFWLHNEWILVDGKKMSKSLGNFYKLKDIIDKGYSAMDLRYFYLSKIYRQQLNFTWENLENAKNSLERLKNILSNLDKSKKINKKSVDVALKQFSEIMNDDLNSAKALSFLWDVLRDSRLNDSEKYEIAIELDKVFGLKLGEEEKIEVPKEVERLVKEREKARKEKNWKKSDELREKIKKLGYAISDTEEGSKINKL
ncbi:MAG: cysteine--tRNA ligase [Nanoarchaeota archaeon]|nr:cysteine--tRNA ligase [Nanoarchaeota archaeon]